MFCEVSPELAASAGSSTAAGRRSSPRAPRSRPRPGHRSHAAAARSQGRRVHQVGLPYHWGSTGLDDAATPPTTVAIVLDPNVHIQESKAATCDIRPAAARGGAARLVERSRGPGRRAGRHRRRPMAMRRRASGSSPTRRVCIGCKACEVACKEWNGVPEDGLELHGRLLRQHRRARARTPGGTSRSSSSGASTGDDGRRRRAALADVARTSASTARTRRASTSARPARCSAPSSAPSSCRRTCATAAATACRPARSA